MKWRPEGWENKYDKTPWHTDVDWQQEDVAIGFEAGADAMLEALKGQGHQNWLASIEGENCQGKWVFIPDEEQK